MRHTIWSGVARGYKLAVELPIASGASDPAMQLKAITALC
jgi:hypothetical protein